MKRHWLMKSEPEVFSIADLESQKTALWDGVRNFQARNFMMKDMQLGDEILFYHSNANPPGIAGVACVTAQAVPDPTQFNRKSEHFDSRSTKTKPLWFCVEVGFKKKFKTVFSLDLIKKYPELKNMLVLKKGQRLSIQPVTADEFNFICKNSQT